MRFSLIICLLAILILPMMASAQQGTEANVILPNPLSLDPASLSRFDVAGRDIVENLFIGLTRLNPRAGQIEPSLAESWTVSPDGLVWTFKLRDDVQWVTFDAAAGEAKAIRAVVAEDVVFALRRACDPLPPAPVTSNIYIIAGCRTYAKPNTFQPLPPETVGVRALDDTTLEIRLLFPAGYFLTMTSQPEFRPLPAEFVNDSAWLTQNIVTSGAWVVQEWIPGSSMRLVRNPFWQGAFEGNLTAVNLRFDIPFDTVPSAMQVGSYDLARLEAVVVDAQGLGGSEMLRASDGNTLTLLGFSFSNVNAEGLPVVSPLDFPEVRRALALGLDREALAGAVFGSGARAAEHFTPRSAIGAPSSPGAAFDPATAQTLLAQTGYPACQGMGQLTFAVGDKATDLLLAQNIVAQWNAHLGCPLETFPIIQTTRAIVIDSAHNTVDVTTAARYPLWILSWSADYPDAQGWVTDALHCDYGYLRVGRACDRVDAVMDQAGLAVEVRDRFPSYNQIETDLFGSLGSFPVVPLTIDRQWWMQQARLSGVASYGALQFDRWTVEQ